MEQKKQNRNNFGDPGQNGNPLDIGELTLSEEAAFLIQLIFEEFEELLNDYPHHAAYCFASIIHLSDTAGDLSHFARRLGMWLWIEVLSFQTEEPLSLRKLADHFETDVKTVQNGIDELVKTGQFEMEWKHRNKIKLVPRMLKETVLRFAEQVVSGIEMGEQEEGAES
ncbi:hypothetical protein C6503_05530 [Candidatus Poribacteria bacterium]|nr:MAG: hypothetical protein C6503_05530 [Candidatus Poribacteria bacterium]